jgi:hypothetical protein
MRIKNSEWEINEPELLYNGISIIGRAQSMIALMDKLVA